MGSAAHRLALGTSPAMIRLAAATQSGTRFFLDSGDLLCAIRTPPVDSIAFGRPAPRSSRHGIDERGFTTLPSRHVGFRPASSVCARARRVKTAPVLLAMPQPMADSQLPLGLEKGAMEPPSLLAPPGLGAPGPRVEPWRAEPWRAEPWRAEPWRAEPWRAPAGDLPAIALCFRLNDCLPTRFPHRRPSDRLTGAGRHLPDPSRRGCDAALHARGHASGGEGAVDRVAPRGRVPGSPREHLPSPAPPRCGSVPARGWHPPVHELARLGAHRLRRVPDLLAAPLARDHRGRGRVPELCRRSHGAPEPGALHRDAGGHRQRHHDGARPMRAGDGRPSHGPRRPGPHPPMGRTKPRCAERLAPVAVRDRPGGTLPGPAPGERRLPGGHALRWIRHRRSGRG